MAQKRSSKTLIILRHAHRDKPMGGRLDNGLSPKGRGQAKEFAALFGRGEIIRSKRKPKLFSSPKRRCVETLEPLGRELEQEVQIDPLLDEGAVEAKVDAFFQRWMDGPDPFLVICTHGDWIPEFFSRKLDARIELRKGGWAVVESDEKKLTVRLASGFGSERVSRSSR